MVAIFFFASGTNAIGAEYSVGPANDDWWTVYPDQSTGSGGEVIHPPWILDALESNPVLIYVHKSCDYCVPQTEAVQNISDEFNGQITFYEIDADAGDSRSKERSNETMQAYDPNGGKEMYVPLTVVATLAVNSTGVVVPVWHSTDEVTGDDWIRDYVEDAISQYDENSGNWNS
ncbi:MAG: thioredoxin family protein [Methanothrix sp.]